MTVRRIGWVAVLVTGLATGAPGSSRAQSAASGADPVAASPASTPLAAGAASVAPDVTEGSPPEAAAKPFRLLESKVAAGTSKRLELALGESFAGLAVITPVVVAHGRRPGPVLCLTAGVHGDELNGVEIVRRVLASVDPVELRGTIVGVPIANPHGFRRSSRYLPDRRDLNRYFPGRERGSSASRIAHALFEGVVRHCQMLVDFHTGSFHRTNLPHLRADLERPEIRRFAAQFGSPVVVHNQGKPGTLRRAATDVGIVSLTYEAGEPMRFREDEIEAGVRGTMHLLSTLDLLPLRVEPLEQRRFMRATWVRAERGGVLLGTVELGQHVESGALLGSVTDPISSERSEIRSPVSGQVLGLALDQVVLPGFAAFHIAVEGGAAAGAPGSPGAPRRSLAPDEGSAEALHTDEPEDQPE